MGRGDVKTRKGKIFRGSFGNKRQRNTNKSVRPILQLNKKKLQRDKIAPVKPKLDPITTSQDEAVKKEIQSKLDPVPSTQDGAVKEQIQPDREEKEILEKEKEKIKDKTESAKSTAPDQIGKEKKPAVPAKSGQDKPELKKNVTLTSDHPKGVENQQNSPPEKPDKSGSIDKAQEKSEKES